jgi:hypothetical protein
MMSKKSFSWLIILVMCPLLINTGCTPSAEDTEKLVVPPEEEKPKVVIEEEKPKVVVEEEKPKVVVEEEKPTVELALKYTPQDSTAYKLIMEARRGIKWEGPVANESAFRGGQTSSRLEMTFTQQIQSTDENGNAVAKITIDSLKHLSLVRDNPVVDFDNSRAKDQDNPFAKLIGQSYTIEITPDGRVSKVIDASQAQAAVKGTSTAHKTASAMLTTERIMDHHTIPAVPAADKNKLKTGDNWSGVKTFSFGLMGSKSYERTYTLKEIRDTDNRRIAVVEMEANPTIEDAEKIHKEQQIGDFSKMFENNETYKGQLTLDLTAGKVEKCFEELQSEWIAVEPTAGEKEEKEPAVLIMTATRIYRLEKID